MARETVGSIERLKPKVILDGTCGTGGHSVEFAPILEPGGTLVCLDRDPRMAEIAKERLNREVERKDIKVVVSVAKYEEAPRVLAENGLGAADAILLDLGINSLHVDQGDRGFSFSQDAPLDMQFNPEDPNSRSAAWIVNNESEATLRDSIRALSDERFSAKIARRIVEYRQTQPIETTTQLASIIVGAYPANQRHKKPHPATRTFQAIRIMANDELRAVKEGAEACLEALAEDGLMIVLSYHSGEDKIIKKLFDEKGTPRPDPTNVFSATTTEGLEYKVEKRGATKPSAEEIERNPRARSARMRTIRRLGGDS